MNIASQITNTNLLNTTVTIGNRVITTRYSPSEYSSFLGDCTVECVEVYVNGRYMDNFTDLDSLNEYINSLVEA